MAKIVLLPPTIPVRRKDAIPIEPATIPVRRKDAISIKRLPLDRLAVKFHKGEIDEAAYNAELYRRAKSCATKEMASSARLS